MKLRNSATLFALRSTTRLAWGLAGLSRGLGALGERIEGAVDRTVRIPMISPGCTDLISPGVPR